MLLISSAVVKLVFPRSRAIRYFNRRLILNGKVNDVYVIEESEEFVRGYVVRSAANGC